MSAYRISVDTAAASRAVPPPPPAVEVWAAALADGSGRHVAVRKHWPELADALDALVDADATVPAVSSSSPDDTARPLLESVMAGIRMRAKTCRPCAEFVDHLNAAEDPHAASAAVPDTADEETR